MPAITIVVHNNLKDHHIQLIENAAPGCRIISCKMDETDKYIAETDILVTWGTMNIQPYYANAAKLKWVHTLSAGVEGMLFPKIRHSDIILTNSRGIHGIPMAEHVFAMILAFTRGLNIFIRNQDKKEWKRTPTDEIHGKTIAVVGLGSIGREIAKRAKGLGMEVVATKQEMTTELFVDELYSPDQLVPMLQTADFIVVTLPLTEKTQGLFTLDQFKAMKRSAYFINVSRGSIVNQEHLVAALEQQLIKGAALDVFEPEPLPENSPLWNMENVILTPHVAALSPYYLDRAIKLFAENLKNFIQQNEMFNTIDKIKGY